MQIEEVIDLIKNSGIHNLECEVSGKNKVSVCVGDHMDEMDLYMDQVSMILFAIKLIRCAINGNDEVLSGIFNPNSVVDFNVLSLISENDGIEDIIDRYSLYR